MFLLAGLAVLACAFLPGAVRAQGDPAAFIPVSGSDLFSAELTVGNNRSLVGYGTFSERTSGSLSTTTFVWKGTRHTITNLISNQTRGASSSWNLLLDISPPLVEDIECLTLRLGDQWLNLADARAVGGRFFWYELDLEWRFRDEIAVSLREFAPRFETRSIDGWGNNRYQPELGMANRELLRMANAPIPYGMTGELDDDLPNARLVSNALAVQAGSVANAVGATDMVWQWGQFLDHDISLSPEAAPGEDARIRIATGDSTFDPFRTGQRFIPFNRSAYDPVTGTGLDNPREQVSVITAFIDASNIYGSEPSRTMELRENDGTGRLRTSGQGRFLPLNDRDLPNDPGNTRGDARLALFVAGDIRANEQVGLTAMHTLFVREHNRLAGAIADANPDLTGQEIFELARKIVGAQMQVITYEEFLPVLLGRGALSPYEGYDPGVDPTIATEFSTAAYRFGHTMLSPSLLLVDTEGLEAHLSLFEAFFDPSLLVRQGISGVLRGLATQEAQAVDTQFVEQVRNMLFGAPGAPGRDLFALNIQRGRDHGLPDYNTVRIACGLPPVAGFAGISSDPLVQAALEEAYGEVRYVDLLAGGLAEDHLPGAMLGETFHAILTDQFQRLRDGDRFWFENDPYFLANPELLTEVRATTLAEIIRRNTAIGDELPARVFGGPPPPEIALTVGSATVREGDPALFTLTRTGDAAWPLVVDVLVTENAGVPGRASSFTARATFSPGALETTLTLPTRDDDILEPHVAVTAALAGARDYRVDSGASTAALTVIDNDGIPIELTPTWTNVVWTGADGADIATALRVGEASDQVVSVYAWDGASGSWLVYSPDLEQPFDLSTLTTFQRGRAYWIAVTAPVTWWIPAAPRPEPGRAVAASP